MATQRGVGTGKTGRINSPRGHAAKSGTTNTCIKSSIRDLTLPGDWSVRHESFCQHYYDTKNQSVSAARAGFNAAMGYYLSRQPRVIKRLEEIEQEYKKNMAKVRVETKILTKEFLEQSLVDIIVKGQKHVGQLHGIRMGFQTQKILPVPGVSFTNNQTMGIMNAPQGNTMAEIYKAKWLRDKEEAMRLQLEAQEPKQLAD